VTRKSTVAKPGDEEDGVGADAANATNVVMAAR
jgi:hypothetical protein